MWRRMWKILQNILRSKQGLVVNHEKWVELDPISSLIWGTELSHLVSSVRDIICKSYGQEKNTVE